MTPEQMKELMKVLSRSDTATIDDIKKAIGGSYIVLSTPRDGILFYTVYRAVQKNIAGKISFLRNKSIKDDLQVEVTGQLKEFMDLLGAISRSQPK